MNQEEIHSSISALCGKSIWVRKFIFRFQDLLSVRVWHVKRELKKWFRNAPPQAHILDIGTGYGHFAYWLTCTKPDVSVLAIDNQLAHVCAGNTFARALERDNLLFKTADVSQLDDEKGFDLVLCIDVLEMIHEDRQALQRIFNSLRSNGTLLLTVNRKFEKDNSQLKTGQVRTGYEMKEIKELLKNIGFHRVKAHYTGGVLGRASHQIAVNFPIKMLETTRLFVVVLPFYYLVVLPFTALFNWLDSKTAHNNGQGIIVQARKP